MSQICQVTGKRHLVGHKISHANNKTKRRFNINIHKKRFWVESVGRWVTLMVSAHGMRIIDKLGIEKVLQKITGNLPENYR
jgi:large subunit ribosomal protein L28